MRNRTAPAMACLSRLDAEAAALLSRFLEEPVSEEAYVELFELDPRCALYLGSHAFAEPRTCGQAGVSDRNGYMIELLGVYRHFGFTPNGKELPDYLPLMVEFLMMTDGSEDPIRAKLIEESMLPLLPPLRGKLAELGTRYLYLCDLLERALRLDLAARPKTGASMEMSHG
jgi:nitrate reductase delta subunit